MPFWSPYETSFMVFEDTVSRLYAVFSNLAFLLPASRALDYGHPAFAALFLVIALLSSPLYHLCIGFAQACLWDIWKLHVLDFWTAELTIPLGGTLFIRFRARYVETFIVIFSIFAVGFLVTGTNSNIATQTLVAGITFAFVVIYVIWHRIAHEYWPDYDLMQMSYGIAFLVLSVVCFVVQMRWPPVYNYIHGTWHISGALGMYFLIGIQKWARPTDKYKRSAAIVGEERTGLTLEKSFVTLNRAFQEIFPWARPVWDVDRPSAQLPLPPTVLLLEQDKKINEAAASFLGGFAWIPTEQIYEIKKMA